MIFASRQKAGKLLSEKLSSYRGKQALVVGLARGGVVVAREVARALSLPLDVLVVKKIPSPYSQELAIGALAPDTVSFVDWKSAHRTGADEDYVNEKMRILGDQIREKSILYRKGIKPLAVKDKIVILVDDGIATGATLEAAIKWLRSKKAKKIVAAVPVAPKDVISATAPEVDEFVILDTPADFAAVGEFYEDFPQVEDSEVVQLLRS